MTRLTIFFKDMQFITSERNELYGQTDFLANCGGLLGLFTGFSFLSIVEIFYFLSLRLICNVRKFGRHFWSGSEILLKDDAYLHK
jgi:amiloride-sensitive sodium channel